MGRMEIIMTGQNMHIKPYPLGAHCEGDGIRFSFVSGKENCGILIYDRKTGRKIDEIPFSNGRKIGNIHSIYVTKYHSSEVSYQFYEDNKIVPDENAALLLGEKRYGKERNIQDLKAGFVTEEFDWQDDRNPRIAYNDSICYLLHVRGFTKHSSSEVSHKGTFRGVMEKLSYLQEIGVTTVELQPAYEFLEIPSREERRAEVPCLAKEEDLDSVMPVKLNYWGYKKAYYYAPKAAYASGNPDTEFKEMVREFHKRGMEIIMQFYFPKEVSFWEIPNILRYWLLEYHVDGFHLMGENLPVDMLAQDPIFADTKFWYYNFNTENETLASYQDNYLYTMRRFLKGDESMVNSVLFEMRHIPQTGGRIHYLTNYYGMTLMDLVSYDRKHNEENGEENRDGNDYNCSWNCGEEGATRKRKVTALRKKMIKNAMCLLLLSQSTPLIFMGDEFGNSQKGNNNPYCQDNATTWLDWHDRKRNAELNDFWKMLIALRKSHPVLHTEREPRIMDYIACGYPDLSYHGKSAWCPQTESYSRTVGMMYCGKYAKVNHIQDDDFFYVAMNMHWETHELGLPRLPKGWKWELLFATEAMETVPAAVSEFVGKDAEDFDVENPNASTKDITCLVAPRSISVFHSVPNEAQVSTVGHKGVMKKAKKALSHDAENTDRTIF